MISIMFMFKVSEKKYRKQKSVYELPTVIDFCLTTLLVHRLISPGSRLTFFRLCCCKFKLIHIAI